VKIMARILGLRRSRPEERFNSWLAWSAACDSVESAYRRWAAVPVAERPLAFARYRAALAIEEEHAASYAAVMTGDRRLQAVAS
jgi:hypothetical protein